MVGKINCVLSNFILNITLSKLSYMILYYPLSLSHACSKNNVLVLSASSAELERHFRNASCIGRTLEKVCHRKLSMCLVL